MDTYVHSMDEHKRREMDKMDDMFGMQYSISVENQPYPVLCTLIQTVAPPMFPTSQKSKCRHQHWTPPCWKSNSKSKKPCASTRTRPFPPNKNKLSYRRTACWYLSRQADRTDRSYFYLPTPQNLSTKSARAHQQLIEFISISSILPAQKIARR